MTPFFRLGYFHRMTLHDLIETITTVAFRFLVYTNNNLVDDPAMLAIIFC